MVQFGLIVDLPKIITELVVFSVTGALEICVE